mgnify:FL=1
MWAFLGWGGLGEAAGGGVGRVKGSFPGGGAWRSVRGCGEGWVLVRTITLTTPLWLAVDWQVWRGLDGTGRWLLRGEVVGVSAGLGPWRASGWLLGERSVPVWLRPGGGAGRRSRGLERGRARGVGRGAWSRGRPAPGDLFPAGRAGGRSGAALWRIAFPPSSRRALPGLRRPIPSAEAFVGPGVDSRLFANGFDGELFGGKAIESAFPPLPVEGYTDCAVGLVCCAGREEVLQG